LRGLDVNDSTNFFDAGATSADVTRLVEETKSASGVSMENAEVYMSPTFGEFTILVVKKLRGDDVIKLEFKKVSMKNRLKFK
jgi:formyltetrahydrofolate dehydrogenase